MVARHHGQAKYSGLLSFTSRSIRITRVLIAATNDDIASSDTDQDNTNKEDINLLPVCTEEDPHQHPPIRHLHLHVLVQPGF